MWGSSEKAPSGFQDVGVADVMVGVQAKAQAGQQFGGKVKQMSGGQAGHVLARRAQTWLVAAADCRCRRVEIEVAR